MPRHVPPANRRAFTLIELMVVIVIIGLLASLGTWAIFSAIRTAKERSIILEINSLSTAVTMVRDQANAFPPCMGAITNSSGTRTTSWISFTRQAWPIYSTVSYSNMRTAISTSSTLSGYNYMTPAGTVVNTDLNHMDQAESLVFWLGGFATPYNPATKARVASRKLHGFHKNPAAPFRRDTTGDVTTFRTSPLYQFDEGRLVDVDEDGWYEYIPSAQSAAPGSPVPPYVYFDARLYNLMGTRTTAVPYSIYPPQYTTPTSGTVPLARANPSLLLQYFGAAVPYAMEVPAAPGQIVWQNGNTFQIISAGLDGRFSGDNVNAIRIPEFPGGRVFRGTGFNTQSSYDEYEEDNLTNFTGSKLRDGAGI